MSDPVIEFRGLTKRFGAVTAVDDVSLAVAPGRVVGLLGRNGAGKTTMLRCLLGLSAPTSGEVLILGHRYADLPRAAHRVGAMLDSIGPTPGATGRDELMIWATSLRIGAARVDAVLDRVDLTGAADTKIRKYSTGMRQRLALAVALLAEPEVLILDEPANGLDPDGIRWLRRTVRAVAAEGRTVLLCSHLLAEIEQTVDDVVVLARSLRYAGPLRELVGPGERLEDRFFDVLDEPRDTPAAPQAGPDGAGPDGAGPDGAGRRALATVREGS